MKEIILFGIIVGCFAWWFITLAGKRGWREHIEATTHSDLVHDLVACNYCLSWWVSVAVVGIAALLSGEWSLLFSVFVSTLVSVKMLG